MRTARCRRRGFVRAALNLSSTACPSHWCWPQGVFRESCGTMGGVRPTVLIVDDHEVFRASARALLQAGGFDVIGEAAGGIEAIEAVSALRPEIVVARHPTARPGWAGRRAETRRGARSARGGARLGPGGGDLRTASRQTSARGFISKSELSGKALAALVGLSARCSAAS